MERTINRDHLEATPMRVRPNDRCVLTLIALLIVACCAGAATAQQPVRYQLADSHVHLVDFLQQTEGIQAMLGAMDACGVEHAMVSGMPLVKQWDEWDERRPLYYLEDDARAYWYSATDVLVAREVLSLPAEARARLHPFICGFNGADRNAVDHVRRMIEWYPGLWEGIGEVMARHDDLTALTYGPTARADTNCLDPVYELAAEFGLPVSLHSNISSVWIREPVYLDELEGACQKHPRTVFIWNHAGVSRRIDVPTIAQEIGRVLTAYPNLYVDISWVVFEDYIYRLNPQTQQRELNGEWVALIEEFPDRFMVGSDKVGRFGNYHEETQEYYVLLDALKPDTARKVARDNFLGLLPKKGATLSAAAEPGTR